MLNLKLPVNVKISTCCFIIVISYVCILGICVKSGGCVFLIVSFVSIYMETEIKNKYVRVYFEKSFY